MACPVIGLDPVRGRIILQGGAVHLSKEFLTTAEGPVFGYLGTVTPEGFGQVLEQAPLTGLSQEHGIVSVAAGSWDDLAGGLRTGDLVPVFPVHSCLACDLHPGMTTLAGRPLPRHNEGTTS